MVKKKARRRGIVAWMLLMALMPFFMVKTLHYHEADKSSDSPLSAMSGHQHTPQDNCLICQFMLSPFIETEILHLDLIQTPALQEGSVALGELSFALSHSHGLRAPPAMV